MTERVGALNDEFLGRRLPLGEARLLWEIGETGSDVRELRRRLALDSGYVSRLLRSLERQGLVSVGRSPRDGRVRRARATAAGVAELAELDRRSDALAASLLEPLGDGQRARLAAAMAEVERLLVASSVTIDVEGPSSREARWCVTQYCLELDERFESGFDPARSLPVDPHELTPPAGVFVVARLRGEPVGCGGLRHRRAGDAELKRMWVAPRMRGLGLGRRLLTELERRAEEAGVATLRLETNGALVEAIDLYRRSGYREIKPFNDEPYAHHWFEKRLSGSAPSTRVGC